MNIINIRILNVMEVNKYKSCGMGMM